MSYRYVLPPFKHQLEGVQLIRNREYYGFFDEPGCGKSKLIVDGCNQLFLEGAICAVVVVCPNTVKATWGNPVWGQIVKHSPAGMPFFVDVLKAGKRLPRVSTMKKGEHLHWIIVNYEALRSDNIYKFTEDLLLNMAPSVFVLDESTKIKNPYAVQTKAIMKLKDCARRRYILTGTPIAKNPLDLFTQLNFLHYNVLRTTSFVAFRNKYAQMGGYRVGGKPVQIVGWKNLDELRELVSHHTRVVYKKDALPELPTKLFTRLEIPLSAEQVTAYTTMKNSAVASVPGEIGHATAAIALTKILRLTQITSGHLPLVNSVTGVTSVVLFKSNPKHDAVIDLLETIEYMVVFAMFIPEIEQLAARFAKEGISYGMIYGATSVDERAIVEEQYRAGQLRVVICQAVTGGIGLTLVKGSTGVFLTNPYSHETRTQAEDRLHRPGQEGDDEDKVVYYDLVAVCGEEQTVDSTVLEALAAKQNLSDTIIGRELQEIL